MGRSRKGGSPAIEPIDPRRLEDLLREAARRVDPQRKMEDLEVRHLVRVMTECSLLLRDVSKSPFKNPTSVENPSPQQYKPNLHEMSRDYSIATNLSSPGYINQQSNDALQELPE